MKRHRFLAKEIAGRGEARGAWRNKNGANAGTRTPDLLFTKQLLYQLSYIGAFRSYFS